MCGHIFRGTTSTTNLKSHLLKEHAGEATALVHSNFDTTCYYCAVAFHVFCKLKDEKYNYMFCTTMGHGFVSVTICEEKYLVGPTVG